MEPVLFYGVPQGCSFGSIVALEWAGHPYRLCRIGMLEQPLTELYRQVNPMMQTPSFMLSDGTILGQSMAIIHHINALSAPDGIGIAQGDEAFDRFNEMLAFLNTDFFSAFLPLWAAYEDSDFNEIEARLLRNLGTNYVRRVCAYLDSHLSSRRWLLGEQRTLADAYFTGVGRWINYHKLFDLAVEFPNIHRYDAMLQQDPAVKFATAIEAGEEPVGGGAWRGHVTLNELQPRLIA